MSTEHKKTKNGYQVRSRVAYHNCLIIAPDGTELAYCDEKKEHYYLSHGLATSIEMNGLRAIKLNFEPKSKSVEKEFLFPRNNACAVCGKKDELTKHHIVPYNYRVNFPIEIKSRNSYDIVALCTEHHAEYERKADKFKKELAGEFGVKFQDEKMDEETFNKKRAKGAAKTLLLYEKNIPIDRKPILIADIKKFLGRLPTQEDILKLCETEKKKAREINDHGKLICDKLKSIDEINDFIIRWRQHFLKVMNPQYMPKDWKVDRKFSVPKDLNLSPENV